MEAEFERAEAAAVEAELAAATAEAEAAAAEALLIEAEASVARAAAEEAQHTPEPRTQEQRTKQAQAETLAEATALQAGHQDEAARQAGLQKVEALLADTSALLAETAAAAQPAAWRPAAQVPLLALDKGRESEAAAMRALETEETLDPVSKAEVQRRQLVLRLAGCVAHSALLSCGARAGRHHLVAGPERSGGPAPTPTPVASARRREPFFAHGGAPWGVSAAPDGPSGGPAKLGGFRG